MDFRHFFENNRAVSPVIGVVLMVAITVILAAAIGSSVFGQGTSDPAPQANLQLQASGIDSSTSNGTVLIEHLGGDPINFDDPAVITNVTTYCGVSPLTNNASAQLATLDVGDTDSFDVAGISSGDTVNIKIIDVATQQLICDQEVRF